ncbi:MAG: FtsX-like permease family protein [Bacteroidota bacterium]
MKSTNYKIAFAHLTSRMKQTLVAVLSVTFGISMYVAMNSFMHGVNDIQDDMAFSTLAHIRVYNDVPEDRTDLLATQVSDQEVVHLRNPKVIQYTEGITNSQKYINFLENNPAVAVVAPEVNISMFFQNGAVKINGMLAGIDPVKNAEMFGTQEYVVEGNWEDLNYRQDGIIIGIGLAKKLSVSLNDNVFVLTADGVTKTYEVVAIFETSMKSVDNGKGYIRINSARQLLSKNMSYVTDIQVNMKEYEKAQAVATQISQNIPYKVESWQESNGQLVAGNELRNIIALAVSLTILLVAGFGIYNIMNMTVNEKIREIAILKAMGFEGRDVVEIFLLQSIVIGVIGNLIGMGLGYLICVIVDNTPFVVGTMTSLPISYRAVDYVLAFIFGLATTFLAGYLPARKASQVDPVEIIRG